jgi:thermostable 8-oxoguanine DNA glycosylase
LETIDRGGEVQTLLTATDRAVFARVITLFGGYVEVAPIGKYRTMQADEVWLRLVGQVCVMGGAAPWDRLGDSPAEAARFSEAVSLEVLAHQDDPIGYLAQILMRFSATRFHNKAAERLVSIMEAPGVSRDHALVIFDGLSHENAGSQTRDELINRCPVFGLKSASDFMIDVGLSHDVIALDTRIVGILRRYLAYNLRLSQIQGNRRRYLSVEAALRQVCDEQVVSLALLDRLLFRVGNVGAMDIAVRYPELWSELGLGARN